MFIQTETTPNPQTLKFLPGVEVMEGGTAFFTSPGEAERSPLATHLFSIEGVHAVFLGRDFISITKDEMADWQVLKAPLLTTIMEHFVAGQPVMAGASQSKTDAGVNESDIVRQIRELIDTRVRPAVAMDGGDIVFHGFENGVVKLEMHGACSGCPSSTATLKQGIETMLKHYVPEVVAVEAVD